MEKEENYYSKFKDIEDDAIRYISYTLYKIKKIEQINIHKQTKNNKITKQETERICNILLTDDNIRLYIEKSSEILQNYLDEIFDEEIVSIENDFSDQYKHGIMSLSNKHKDEIISLNKDMLEKYNNLKKPWRYGYIQSLLASLTIIILPAIAYALIFIFKYGWEELLKLLSLN